MELNWSAWQTIADGPYTGTPQLSLKTVSGVLIISCIVMDESGDLWEIEEQAANQWGGVFPMGGKDIGAHTPIARSRPPAVVTGKDNQLYVHRHTTKWELTGGNGRLSGEAIQLGGMADNLLMAGIGMDQDVWWAKTTIPNMAEWKWTALGKPEDSVNVVDRPSITFTDTGSFVLVRGEDGRLYNNENQRGLTWSGWQFVADNIGSAPVAVTRYTRKHVECYFYRQDDSALGWAIWNGAQWSQPNNGRLGGQMQGEPAAAASLFGDRTYVFGRGTEEDGHTQLWYLFRDGAYWGEWQTDEESIITSSPSVCVIDSAGPERLVVVALNLERALVQRTCTIKP
jgi:hypothetical protein